MGEKFSQDNAKKKTQFFDTYKDIDWESVGGYDIEKEWKR